MKKLFLRLYADCSGATDAIGIEERLMLALRELSPTRFSDPKQYWKMSHLWEFTYELTPRTSEAFHVLIAKSETGWHHQNEQFERSSIWNRSECNRLLIREVFWAELSFDK